MAEIADDLATSPIKERKNSLQHALARRPDQKELEERRILHTGAPAIQQRQIELEKAMTQDSLKKQLSHRPVKEELIQRNILPENSNIAPALIAQQRELEKSMREDLLKEKLAHRPEPAEVIKKGILSPDEDPTSPTD
ncbi:hypothetical protein RUND412_003766 [Rhizina undulata]